MTSTIGKLYVNYMDQQRKKRFYTDDILQKDTRYISLCMYTVQEILLLKNKFSLCRLSQNTVWRAE